MTDMDLKIKDVAELLNISETTIRRWITESKIPAYRINHQYRFSRTEIEDWVMKQKLGNSKEEEQEKEREEQETDQETAAPHKGGNQQFSLYRAVHKGGVYNNIPGTTKEEVIRNTMKVIAKQLDLDAEVLTDLLLDRESLMPTALNNGIGVPHTRDFLLKHHDAVAIVFPEKPIEYGALDGDPVHTLFFLFACEDKRHLHLLAKIAHMGSSDEILAMLKKRPNKEALLEFIRNWEGKDKG
jgi:nitrogen PTS system EIIA component